MSDVHIIKLVVGVSDLQEFYEWQQREVFDYHGQPAVPCWTRYAPKIADDILKNEGSIYRVIKNHIVCRHKILGFEMVETHQKGTMCMIVQDAEMIQTVSMPRRPFQGWRYIKGLDIPPDRGVYSGVDLEGEPMSPDMAEALKAAGLL